MDSTMTSVSPDSTRSPGFDVSFQTVPVISDLISMRAMPPLAWECLETAGEIPRRV